MNLSRPKFDGSVCRPVRLPSSFLRRMCFWGVCLVFAGGLILAAGPAGPVRSQSLPVAPEYYFKAAFLANFARMIDWPQSVFERDDQPLILCVLDARPFGGALEAIEGKLIRGRRMTVRVCDQIQEVPSCHILFANSTDAALRAAFIQAHAGRPVLIVGEEKGFALNEGMIGFYPSQNRIHFMINPVKIEQVGLRISSRLLRLGRIVRSAKQE